MRRCWLALTMAWLAMAVLFLSGCGFHLRDTPLLDQRFSRMYLSTPAPYENLTRELRTTLWRQKVRVCDTAQQAPIGLYVLAMHYGHDTPTLSNSSTARVYRYFMTLDFELKARDGRMIGPIHHIQASRFTTMNAGVLTTTNNQVALVEQGLIEDVVRQMLWRISNQAL